ncbi:MAG TPA: hypothetical protein VF902_02530, partial [Coriobacteriia bacterium]
MSSDTLVTTSDASTLSLPRSPARPPGPAAPSAGVLSAEQAAASMGTFTPGYVPPWIDQVVQPRPLEA